VEHTESTLPKNLSAEELSDLIIAIDGYFLLNYSNKALFNPVQLKEIEGFLDLRHEVLVKYQALSPQNIYINNPMNENIIHILIALISALGSVGAWRFYETKLRLKSNREGNPQQANENFIKDLQERVNKLEALLIESSEEKDEMRDKITELSSEVSGLKVKLKFLEVENANLKGKKSRK
jgi:hypothetical protein